MSLELRTLPESERVRLQGFLQGVFRSPDDALFIEPTHMHWKYWESHPAWTGSRSYAYVDDSEEIVAHACAWPFGLRTSENTLAGIHPIDWAAGMKIPGAGALLLRQIRALRDISCCIGGTEIAQNVIRQIGFKPATTMQLLARPLRPLHQALNHQRRNWKLPARLLRNTAWTMRAASVPAGWTAEPVRPADISDGLLPSPAQGLAVTQRSAALFEYLLKCPIARYQLWLVREGSEPRGYFLLSFVPGQARVADAWITSAKGESWLALYALSVEVALRDSSAAEITTSITLAEAFTGAAACGFRSYTEVPVMLFDPNKHLVPVNRFHMQLIDNDMSFLHENSIDYVT